MEVGGLTVFQIMSGLRVWRKEAVILHNIVRACVCDCVRQVDSEGLLCLSSLCHRLRLAWVLSTSRVTQQVSTGLLAAHHRSKKVITP